MNVQKVIDVTNSVYKANYVQAGRRGIENATEVDSLCQRVADQLERSGSVSDSDLLLLATVAVELGIG